MRVLIYGAGAVGLGLASCLSRAGCRVVIVGRPMTVAAIRESGLQQSGIFGSHLVDRHNLETVETLDALPKEAFDYVLVCTKSFDTGGAALDLHKSPQMFHPATRIVLCQNGWGNADIFAERFSKDVILDARVITGFSRPAPNHVEVTVHAEPIRVGSIFHSRLEAQDLCAALAAGGIPAEDTTTVAKDLWAKLCYNCALNPLGAILQVPYGALADAEPTRQIMDGIIQEVFAVMTASGYSTHVPNAQAYLELFYGKLVPATAAHCSSMLQDITAGRRTEIDAINGAVICLAGQHQLPVPLNQTLFNLLKFAERRARSGHARPRHRD